jgi:ribosomal protein L11 methyltransferase
VPETLAEEARARLLPLSPGGFEEIERDGVLELVVYTDRNGEERLAGRFDSISASDLEPGWEDRWREFHRPVSVVRLWIGPPWHARPDDALAVVVDPGRAFGTGAHASTRLCLELLQAIEPTSLLDVGCGSGVIAIAAAKLGFGPVVAVDVDEHAVDATARNAAANEVEVDVQRIDARTQPLPPTEVAVANLTLELVEQIAPRLACQTVIAAGYLGPEAPRLPEFRSVQRLEVEGWAADRFERVAQ